MVRSCGGVDPARLPVWQAVGGCLLNSSAGVCTLPYPALSNDRRVKGCYAWRAYGRWHARPYPLTGGVCCRGWQAQGHCYLPPISHLVLPCLAGARVIAGTRSSYLIGGRWFGTCFAWQVRGGSVCRGPSLTVPQGGGGGSDGGVGDEGTCRRAARKEWHHKGDSCSQGGGGAGCAEQCHTAYVCE